MTGGIRVTGRPEGSVWISSRDGGPDVEITEAGVAAADLRADAVVLAGRDLQGRIEAIGSTPGVGESNVRAVHVAPASLDTARLGGPIEGRAGGTGLASLRGGGVLAVAPTGGYLDGVASLTVAPQDGGLRVAGSVRISSGGGIGQLGEVVPAGTGPGRGLLDLERGASPEVTAVSHAAGALSWTAVDPDGGLRRVAVRYGAASPAPSPEEVLASPDDWADVDEGGHRQVFVGEGGLSAPHFGFFRDRAGALPLLRGAGAPMVLVAGHSYRFERTAAAGAGFPFWIGATPAADFTAFAVTATAGRDRTSGITGSGDYIQVTIPAGFSGALNYFSTAHPETVAAFEVRGGGVGVRGGAPLGSWSGAFGTAGQAGAFAHVAAENASGRASAVVTAALA
eukprot:jgi/Tetstr1/454132/TSEL_041051.t1